MRSIARAAEAGVQQKAGFRRMPKPPISLSLVLLLWLNLVAERTCSSAQSADGTNQTSAFQGSGSLLPAAQLKKREYTIAYMWPNEELELLHPTFQAYLTERAAAVWDEPVTFKAHELRAGLEYGSQFKDGLLKKEFDFIFAPAEVSVCMQAVLNTAPLASVDLPVVSPWNTDRAEYEAMLAANYSTATLNEVGAVMFTRPDNSQINTVADLKDKIIGIGLSLVANSVYMQDAEMQKHGLNYLVDAAQVRLYYVEGAVMQDVLDGKIDVGFVRSSHYDREILDGTIKILNPREGWITPMGRLQLFTSTDLVPLWSVMAAAHTDLAVTGFVAKQLMQIDFRDDIARTGGYAGFGPPIQHGTARSILQRSNYLTYRGDKWRCASIPDPGETLDMGTLLSCPSGLTLAPQNEMTLAANSLNCINQEPPVDCPLETALCTCRPCLNGTGQMLFVTKSDDGRDPKQPCQKMQVCGVTRQNIGLDFYYLDEAARRIDAEVWWLLEDGTEAMSQKQAAQKEKNLPEGDSVGSEQKHDVNVKTDKDKAAASEPQIYEGTFGVKGNALPNFQGSWRYDFSLSSQRAGAHLVKVYVNGVELPNSPVYFVVLPSDCGGQRVANSLTGECECLSGSISFGTSCVDQTVLLVASLCPIALMMWAIKLRVDYVHRKRLDTHWILKWEDLEMSTDPATLHLRGSVKEILRGTYKNVDVALKGVQHYPSFDAQRAGLERLHSTESQSRCQNFQFPWVATAGWKWLLSLVFRKQWSVSQDGAAVRLESSASTEKGEELILTAVQKKRLFFLAELNDSASRSTAALDPLDEAHPLQAFSRQSSADNLDSAAGDLAVSEGPGSAPSGLPLAHPATLEVEHTTTASAFRGGCVNNGSVKANVGESQHSGPDQAINGLSWRPHSGISARPPSANSASTGELGFLESRPSSHGTITGSFGPLFAGSRPASVGDLLHSQSSLRQGRWRCWAVEPVGRMLTSKQDIHRRRAFASDMRQLSELQHPSITTVFGAVQTESESFLVLEYMHYGALSVLLGSDIHILDCESVKFIMMDVLSGLAFLHNRRPCVPHGFLSTKNILLDNKFRAKLSDFGPFFGGSSREGEIACMAPELLLDGKPSREADCFALGMLMWEVASRQLPFAQETLSFVTLRRIVDPAEQLRPTVPDSLSASIREVILHCWRHNPKERPCINDIRRKLDAIPVGDFPEVGSGDASSHGLVFDNFPLHVAEALMRGEQVKPDFSDCATVVFLKVSGLSVIPETEYQQRYELFERLFSELEKVAREHRVQRVETIGDTFLGVTNLIKRQETDHAPRMVNFAYAALEVAGRTPIDLRDPAKGFVRLRIGLNSGSLTGGVAGYSQRKYTIFGNTVNVASRMESTGSPGRVQCTERTANLLKTQDPKLAAALRPRGKVNVKGRGEMMTYLLKSKTDQVSLHDSHAIAV